MQPTEWKKIFVNHTYNKALIFKICKELLQFNNKHQLVWPLQKKKKENNRVGKEVNWNPCTLQAGMQNYIATMENSIEVLQKIKNRTII